MNEPRSNMGPLWFRRPGTAALTLVCLLLAALPAAAAGKPSKDGPGGKQADLYVATFEYSPDQSVVGQRLILNMTVFNNYYSNASSNATLTVALPTQMKFLAASISRGSCTGGQTVTCSVDSVAPSEAVGLSIDVQAVASGALQTVGEVSGSTPDPYPYNNSAFAYGQVFEPSMLPISCSNEPGLRWCGADLFLPADSNLVLELNPHSGFVGELSLSIDRVLWNGRQSIANLETVTVGPAPLPLTKTVPVPAGVYEVSVLAGKSSRQVTLTVPPVGNPYGQACIPRLFVAGPICVPTGHPGLTLRRTVQTGTGPFTGSVSAA